jgi:excisionase family DNA binding protein
MSAIEKEFRFTDKERDPTPEQTCDIFQISRPTFYRLVKKGKLDVYKVGNGTRVKRESINSLRNGE